MRTYGLSLAALGVALMIPVSCRPTGVASTAATISGPSPRVEGLTMRRVMELNPLENNDALLFDHGYLFSGYSTGVEAGAYVNVYTGDGRTLVQKVDLPHSPHHLYSMGDGRVAIFGIRSELPSRRNVYTSFLASDGQKFSLKTKFVSYQLPLDQGAPAGPDFYFGTTPGATYASHNEGALKMVSREVKYAGRMLFADGRLFAIDRLNPGLGDEQLRVITPGGPPVSTNFATIEAPRGLTHLTRIEGRQAIAINERVQGRIFYLSTQPPHALLSVLQVEEDASDMAVFGHCLVVTSANPQIVSIVDHQDLAHPKVIMRWDVGKAGGGENLRQPTEVEVNPETGMVFLRSNHVCTECGGSSQSSVWSVEDTTGEMTKRCR